jgi:hypothetical protein
MGGIVSGSGDASRGEITLGEYRRRTLPSTEVRKAKDRMGRGEGRHVRMGALPLREENINHDRGANPGQVVRAPDDIVVRWEDIVEPRLLPRTDLLTSLRYSPICVPLSVLVVSGRRSLLLNRSVKHVKMASQSGCGGLKTVWSRKCSSRDPYHS